MKCKLIRKIFSSIKSWVIEHEFLSWTFASVLFAFVIHCLFSKEAPTEWLGAEWSAGEILTYTSTVALGLLALWQNKRFKKANDEAQERMEELTKYANELTLKSQIIESESIRINNLKHAIDEFSLSCDPMILNSKCTDSLKIDKKRKSIAVELTAIIREKYLNLKRELENEHSVNMKVLLSSAYDYYSYSDAFLDILFEPESYTDEDKEIIFKEFESIYKKFIIVKDKKILEIDKTYYSLIFNNLTIDEIKSKYSIDNHFDLFK